MTDGRNHRSATGRSVRIHHLVDTSPKSNEFIMLPFNRILPTMILVNSLVLESQSKA
jgi:hypothetical protein